MIQLVDKMVIQLVHKMVIQLVDKMALELDYMKVDRMVKMLEIQMVGSLES